MQYLFFDTETSGFISGKKDFNDPTQAWCCQLAAILTDEKGTELGEMSTIIKANGRDMPSFLVDIHGITAERADAEGIEESEALEHYARMLKDMPKRIGHNYDFDHKFIDQMFKRNMEKLTDFGRSRYFLQLPTFCTMKDKDVKKWCGAKNVKGHLKFPKLEELYHKLFNKDFPNAHDALADTRATKECYFELIKQGVITI